MEIPADYQGSPLELVTPQMTAMYRVSSMRVLPSYTQPLIPKLVQHLHFQLTEIFFVPNES